MTPGETQPHVDSLKRAVGTAIHDINNLLLVISCSISKLLEQIPSTDSARDTAAEIVEANGRIAEITARLQNELTGLRPSIEVHPQPADDVAKNRTGETVLVVDDDSQVRQFIKTALVRGGYQVLEARHGPAAIAVALRHRGAINLLVADMLMPEMTGRELADALRTDIPNLRVVFLSGLDSSTEILSEISSQSKVLDAFVQKPFRMPELLLKIREILDK